MEAANKTLPIVQITDNGGKTNQQAVGGKKAPYPMQGKSQQEGKWFGSSKGCTATPPTALEPQPRGRSQRLSSPARSEKSFEAGADCAAYRAGVIPAVCRPCWIWAPPLLAAFCPFKAKNKDWSVAGAISPSPPVSPAGRQRCSVSLQGTQGSPCPDTASSSCCSPGCLEWEVKLSSEQVQLGTGSVRAVGRPLVCHRGLGEGAELSLPTHHSREEHEHATLTRCFTGQPCLARPRGAQTCSSSAGT